MSKNSGSVYALSLPFNFNILASWFMYNFLKSSFYIYITEWKELSVKTKLFMKSRSIFFVKCKKREFDLGLNLTIGIDTCPFKKIMG